MSESSFQIVFLGLAERTSQVGDAGTNLLKWNVLGLKGHLLTHFLPVHLAGVQMCFAMRGRPPAGHIAIRILGNGGEVGGLTLSQSVPLESVPEEERAPFAQILGSGWTVFALPVPNTEPNIILFDQRSYRLSIRRADEQDYEIGEFHCLLVEPPHLTPERIAAIRNTPLATKAVRMEFGCRSCTTKLRAYAGLERIQKLEAEGYIWSSDLPNDFECSCKATRFSLQSIRNNLRAALGATLEVGALMDPVPLYNKSVLVDITRRFYAVLGKSPKEEVIQTFMKENPIILHQFPSVKILTKPSILTFFSADFAILTPKKELILVEIERADTRLLRKDGGEASQLTHAFDQVRNWLHVVDEHRLAVLAALDIPPAEVSSIKGVVIAGRDGGQNQEHLRRLKGGSNRERITFLTFDDLAMSLALLAENVGRV